MTLITKLQSGFGAMLALTVILSAGGALDVRSSNRELDRAIKISARKQLLAGEVNAAAASMAGADRGVMLASELDDKEKSAEYLAQVDAGASQLREALAGLRELDESAAAAIAVQNIERNSIAAIAAHSDFSSALAGGQINSGLELFVERVEPEFAQIAGQASSLVTQQSGELAALSAESAAKSARNERLLSLAALAALIVGGAVFFLVRRATAELKRLAASMAQNAGEVANGASQVSSASQSLAQGASEQAASLEQTSASAEEIASITHRNADHAVQVAGMVQEAGKSAGELDQTLEQMSDKMKEIDASSNNIARIIKVIDDIAFQTNILALNAAVEAARAGEAGLGFAVVADEVRSLAQRCAQAAKDTAALIQASIETSRDGNVRLERMAVAARGMTGIAARVKSLVDEVSTGSQEQTRGMDQIARAVLQMQTVTQKTAAAAQQSASAGAELNAQADSLRALVLELREMVGAGSN